jgi:hypothetical protein
MPGFDRSGPMGAGPMTEVAEAFAAARQQRRYGSTLSARPRFRQGTACRTRRQARFQSYGAGYPADAAAGRVADTDEVRYLRASVEELKSTVGRIEQRLSELNTNSSD